MAKKTQAWTAYGPRLAPATPVTSEELIEQVTTDSNKSRATVLGTLARLDEVIEQALRSGRIVHLPNGTYLPARGQAGRIGGHRRAGLPGDDAPVNNQFNGEMINAQNADKTEEEIIALRNAEHPDDPTEV